MTQNFAFVVIIVLLALGSSCSHHRHSHHGFKDTKKWEKIFEDEKRNSWQKPELIINAMGIKENSIVADIGSATGYFPVRLAKKARKGRVWGIDIEPELVRFLNQRARKENIPNLYSIMGLMSDPMLPEPVDYILLVNTYHHIEAREAYFKKLKASLAPGGKVVIVDFKREELPLGPPLEMKLSAKEVIQEMKAAGLQLMKKEDILEYQYFLMFK